MRTPSSDRDAAITSWPPAHHSCSVPAFGGSPGWGGQRPPSHPPRRDLTCSAVAVSSFRISSVFTIIILISIIIMLIVIVIFGLIVIIVSALARSSASGFPMVTHSSRPRRCK